MQLVTIRTATGDWAHPLTSWIAGLLGAVGVSGAASEEDEEAARVAIDRWTAG